MAGGRNSQRAWPDDGVTRYDAAFAPDGRTLVATSEAGGIPNLERLDSADAHATKLSNVTGAAVAAADGSCGWIAPVACAPASGEPASACPASGIAEG